MAHVIFNTTNICSVTWLEREEIRQIHILNNREANVYHYGARMPPLNFSTKSNLKSTGDELRPNK